MIRHKTYYQDLLLQQLDLYPEIQEQMEKVSEMQLNETSSSEKAHVEKEVEKIRTNWLKKCNQKVQCLLIATSVSMEIFILNKSISIKLVNINGEIDQLFRKQEADVNFFDFIHYYPSWTLENMPNEEGDSKIV